MKKVLSLVLAFVITASVLCVGVSAQSQELTLEETLYQAFQNCETEIDVSNFKIPWDSVDSVVSPLLQDFEYLHPEIFHLNLLEFGYNGNYVNGKIYLTRVRASYEMSLTQYKKQLRGFEFWTSEIAGKIDKDATDLEKVLFAHEYFMAHFEYDLTYQIYDAYNFFKYKTGVCQAYTLAFTAVMQKMGVFCTSVLDEGDNHCWNIVKIDNNYYHIDVTHDDEIYTFNNCGMANHCKRDHLLLSDNTMKSLPQHTKDWYKVGGDFVCDDTTYENEIWDKYEHPTIFYDNKWYQVDCENVEGKFWNANIYNVLENGQKNVLYSFKTPAWWYTGEEYLKFINAYAIGHEIYVSSGNTLWKYNLKTGEFTDVFNVEHNIVESAHIGGGKIRLVVYTNQGLVVQYEQLLIGDSDDSGSVDGKDIVSLKKYLLLHESDKNVGFMDMNGDCFVDILDFIAIEKAIIG